MRVIIFSWEFPPRIVGQLSYYVNRLAVELVKKNLDVHIVTYHESWISYQVADGVKVYRITNPVKTHINILTWVLTLNQEVERVSADIYYSANCKIDLIDVHDWHFITAAVSLKKALRIPFVFSVDSLENHRSRGSNAPLSLSIEALESLGANEADFVTVKSDLIKKEVNRIYSTPLEKIEIVSPASSTWIVRLLKVYEKCIGNFSNSDSLSSC